MLSSRWFRKVVAVALISGSFALSASSWSAPLPEVFASRAGRLIFGELVEGSLLSNRILGTNVANPETRLQRLNDAFADPRLSAQARELEARLTRMEEEFARAYPNRVREVFGPGGASTLAEGERRLIRDLVTREFDTRFVDEFGAQSYVALRGQFLRGDVPRGPRAAMGALTAPERAFVFWETQKNAASQRLLSAVPIENYEIPIELVEQDIARRISPELRDSLIIEKGGRRYVRWIINPEDTIHYKDVEAFLRSHGIAPTRYRSFEAYQTASRSYVIVDSTNGRHTVFTAKVSTNVTGGAWRDKKQPVQDAREARRAADFVVSQNQRLPFRNVVVMDEPAMFGLVDIDQGMLVRSLADMPSGDVTYLPGFSAVHTDLGARIARANGVADVAAFWNEHYNKPLARAIAELAAKTGLTYDSPHSQNFLIEMVGVTPTGRIVMRDFGDTYALAEFFESSGNAKFLREWEQDNVARGALPVSVGILHGNQMPSWMTEAKYLGWGQDFYKVFESEFSSITGIPSQELGARMSQNGRYFSKSYRTQGAGWVRYLNRLGSQPSR